MNFVVSQRKFKGCLLCLSSLSWLDLQTVFPPHEWSLVRFMKTQGCFPHGFFDAHSVHALTLVLSHSSKTSALCFGSLSSYCIKKAEWVWNRIQFICFLLFQNFLDTIFTRILPLMSSKIYFMYFPHFIVVFGYTFTQIQSRPRNPARFNLCSNVWVFPIVHGIVNKCTHSNFGRKL